MPAGVGGSFDRSQGRTPKMINVTARTLSSPGHASARTISNSRPASGLKMLSCGNRAYGGFWAYLGCTSCCIERSAHPARPTRSPRSHARDLQMSDLLGFSGGA
jgi:hypothetical protein